MNDSYDDQATLLEPRPLLYIFSVDKLGFTSYVKRFVVLGAFNTVQHCTVYLLFITKSLAPCLLQFMYVFATTSGPFISESKCWISSLVNQNLMMFQEKKVPKY